MRQQTFADIAETWLNADIPSSGTPLAQSTSDQTESVDGNLCVDRLWSHLERALRWAQRNDM